MHWVIYISILVIGVVLFRHYLSACVIQNDLDQFVRNRIQYELNQDLINLYQKTRPFNKLESKVLQTISTIQITGHIGNRWLDFNAHFINGLENMMQFLALYRGFKYRLDIDKSICNSAIDLKTKRKTFIHLLEQALLFENEKLNYINIKIVNQKVITHIET